MLIAVAVLGVVLLPAISYLKSSLQWLLFLDDKQKSENMILNGVLDLERDFKDMTEVVYCSSQRIDFYMDSYRLPTYLGTNDFDGDGELNDADIDDDNDGLDARKTIAQFFTWISAPASLPGWRSGLDLQDDDDDNNGKRDVFCRYQYFPGTKDLRCRFQYNGLPLTPWKVIVSNVVSFSFTPSGGSPTEIDPNTESPPPVHDVNGNGVLDLVELEVGTPDGILNVFNETRYVRDIRYSMTVQPNPRRPETNSIASTIRPPLMAVKEKFQ